MRPWSQFAERACWYQLGRVQMKVRRGQWMSDGLMGADRQIPDPPVFCIPNGFVNRVATDSGADRTRQNALGIQATEGQRKTAMFLADEVRGGHFHVVEDDFV